MDITCLAFPEIIAEKLRACYQRNKARDIYDLSVFAKTPLDQPLIRRLIVLKLWQVGVAFSPPKLMGKFEDLSEFDWADLKQLVRRTQRIEPSQIARDCLAGFAFLTELSSDELILAGDPHQRERKLWRTLSDNIRVYSDDN